MPRIFKTKVELHNIKRLPTSLPLGIVKKAEIAFYSETEDAKFFMYLLLLLLFICPKNTLI